MNVNEVKIEGENDIEKCLNIFNNEIKKFNEKKYASNVEESHRLNKLSLKEKIKSNIDSVWKEFLILICKDLNSKLKVEQLEKNAFYHTDLGIVFRLTEYDIEKKIISIEWFANEQWFTRLIRLKSKGKDKTKIIYTDVVKGIVAISGFLQRRVLNTYNKKQINAFKIQMIDLKFSLDLIDKTKLTKTRLEKENLIDRNKKIY